MSSITIIRDTPSCGVTYDCHSDDSRGIIYNHNIFIIQAAEIKTFFVAILLQINCNGYSFDVRVRLLIYVWNISQGILKGEVSLYC